MTTTPSSQFHSQLRLLLLLPVILVAVILAAAAEAQGQGQGCRDMCGNMSIPFPFGMGKPGCFRKGFEVVSNHSWDPPRAFLADRHIHKRELFSNDSHHGRLSPLELVSISVATGEARVYAAVSSRCSTKNYDSSRSQEMDFWDTPFAVSATRNVLISVGFKAEAELRWSVVKTFLSTTNFTCRGQDGVWSMGHLRNGSCTGWGCCEQTLPADEGSGKEFMVSVKPVAGILLCSYGMLVEKSWYNFSQPDMMDNKTLLKRFPRGVPLVLDFAPGNTWCPAEGQAPPPDYACVSGNSSCANATTNERAYSCKCRDNYTGNPYIANGCQDIDECKQPQVYPCSNGGICKNRLGGYDCPCKFGMKDDGKGGTCTDVFPPAAKATVGKLPLHCTNILDNE